MTSANNFNGITTEGRNSSRVLKPPGGGHSDIFGLNPEPVPKSTPKRSNIPRSTIQDVFSSESTDNKKTEENKTEDELKITNGEPGDENKEPNPPKVPQRTRVPPGGFSSGLW